MDSGACEDDARLEADADTEAWLRAQEVAVNRRYEKELMNPREALALGSISSLVMPTDLRTVLGENLDFLVRRYVPSPMGGVQREFH
jgi:acetyl-CoA carboxylase carboxyltransferase component